MSGNRIEHKYDIGNDVWHEVTAENRGIRLSVWMKFTVVGIHYLDRSEVGCNSFLVYDIAGRGIRLAGIREQFLNAEEPK